MDFATDSSRAPPVFDVNCLMTTRVFSVAGFLGLCLPLFGQPSEIAGSTSFRELRQSDIAFSPARMFSGSETFSFAALSLGDPSRFSLASPLSWMTGPDALLGSRIDRSPNANQRAATKPVGDYPNNKLADIQPRVFDYVSGEVGVLYGRSSGKHGGDFGQGYIIGEVGNETIQIRAGASYQEWNGRSSRSTR